MMDPNVTAEMLRAFYGGYDLSRGSQKRTIIQYPDWLNEIDLSIFFKQTRPGFSIVLCLFHHIDCKVNMVT